MMEGKKWESRKGGWKETFNGSSGSLNLIIQECHLVLTDRRLDCIHPFASFAQHVPYSKYTRAEWGSL